MQSEEFYRFVRSGSSLTARANEQSGGDSVAVRVDHDEMCQLDHILSFDWLFAAPNRARSEFQNDRRFGRMKLRIGMARKPRRCLKRPMGAGSITRWLAPWLVVAKSVVLLINVNGGGDCGRPPAQSASKAFHHYKSARAVQAAAGTSAVVG